MLFSEFFEELVMQNAARIEKNVFEQIRQRCQKIYEILTVRNHFV